MMPSTVLEPSSANGSDSPVSFAISENQKRVPHWDSGQEISSTSLFSLSRRGFESL
jgi:hypothetical protein